MPPPPRAVFYAPACIMGGMAMVAVSDNFVGQVAGLMGLGQFQVVRGVAALVVVVIIAAAMGQLRRFRVSNPMGVAVRTAFNVAALMMYFAALPTVPIAQAAAGIFTSPVWVAVFSSLFFGAAIGPRRILGVVIGFGGVLLVLQVGQAPLHPMSLLGVAAGMSYAMNVIWTRRHCANETSLAIAWWNFVGYMAAGAVLLAIGPLAASLMPEGPGRLAFLLRGWEPMTVSGASLAAIIGATAIISSALLAEGYKNGESSLAALFDFSFLLWAPLFAWILWSETITGLQALGMALIISAGALAIWSGARRQVSG